MFKIYQAIFALCFFGVFFLGCSNKHKSPKPGKYGTHRSGYSSIKYFNLIPMKLNQMHLEHKHKKDFKDMLVITLILREDSSFIFSNCQGQISRAGKYIFEKDSLKLYNVFDFYKKEKSPDEVLYVDKKGKMIFFNYTLLPDSFGHNKNNKYKEQVSSVQYNKFHHHQPHIRNENWSLDSIYKYNELWPLDRQLKYLDSVSKIYEK